MEIKRIIVECKCGRKLADWHDKPYQAGENLMMIVPPCECAAQQPRALDVCPAVTDGVHDWSANGTSTIRLCIHCGKRQ